MLRTLRAIVLERKKQSEKDAILKLLTEDGSSLTVKIHGILESRTRSRAITEPGVHGEFTVYRKAQAISSVKESTVLESFESIRGTYEGQFFLSALIDPLRLCITEEPNSRLYELLLGAMQYLSRKENATQPFPGMQDILLMLYFKARLLDSLGLLAEPERCAQCDSPLGSTALHSSGEVAFICHRCRTDALRKDRYLAAVLGLSRQQFFAEFAREVNRWLRHMQSELAFDAHDIALEVLDWNRYLDRAMNEYPGKENRFTEEIYRWFLAGL